MPRNPLTLAQTGSSGLPEITGGQKWTGIAVLAAMAVGILYIWYRTRFVGLPPSNADHKDTLWSQLYHRDPATLRLPATANVTDYRSDLRELAAGASDAVDKREATVSGAIADAKVAAAQTYAPVLEKLPTSAIRTIELAMLVAVLGAPAVSTAVILELLRSGGDSLTLGEIVTALVDATTFAGTLAIEAMTAFPYAGTLFSLGLTVVMLGGEWLFYHWYVTAAILVGGAVAIVALDYYREQTFDRPIYEDRRNLGLTVVLRVGIVWAAGAIPTLVGMAAGVRMAGAVVGILLAAMLTVYFVVFSVVGFVSRIVSLAGVSWPWGGADRPEPLTIGDSSPDIDPTIEDGISAGLEYDPFEAALNLEAKLDATDHDWRGPPGDWALAGYLIVRRAILVAWLLVAPLPVAYAVTGVTSGAYADVLAALVDASVGVKLVVGACLLAPLAALIYLGRGSIDDFVTGVRETISRRRVRLAAMRRGVPVMAVVATCAIVYSITQVVWLAIVASVAVGVVARVAYELLMAAKYRVSMFDWYDDVDRTVLVEAYVLEDADGAERYYARLNGSTDVLVDSRDEFADAVIDAYPAAARRDEDVATVPMWRADFALRYGIVDPGETETKLKERVRKRALRELRDEQWAYRSELEATTAEYPREKLESWLRWGRRHGVLSVEADATGDDVVLLKRDPWKNEGRSA